MCNIMMNFNFKMPHPEIKTLLLHLVPNSNITYSFLQFKFLDKPNVNIVPEFC